MAQSKKKRSDKKIEEPSTKGTVEIRISRRTLFTVIGVIIAIMLIILGAGYYQNYVAPFRQAIVKVDNQSLRMDYFLKRAKLSGSDPMAMLQSLGNELLIRVGAPQYGISVSPQDIERELRIRASGSENSSENITDAEFREWYRQQLNESKLSDSEFKEIARTGILAARLQEYLANKVPTVAEQVHLHAIVLKTYDDAEKARARLKAGENFADLASELSLDEQAKKEAGDVGWVPRGILDSGLDNVIFNLKVGEVSASTPYSSDPQSGTTEYYLFIVSEKANKELTADHLDVLKSKALGNWLQQEAQYHDVRYNFNSEIYAWINWQLSKSKPAGTQNTQQNTQQ